LVFTDDNFKKVAGLSAVLADKAAGAWIWSFTYS